MFQFSLTLRWYDARLRYRNLHGLTLLDKALQAGLWMPVVVLDNSSEAVESIQISHVCNVYCFVVAEQSTHTAPRENGSTAIVHDQDAGFEENDLAHLENGRTFSGADHQIQSKE